MRSQAHRYLYGSTEWELVEGSLEDCCMCVASTSVVCSQILGLFLVNNLEGGLGMEFRIARTNCLCPPLCLIATIF